MSNLTRPKDTDVVVKPLANATPRLLNGKLKEIVSIEDYGGGINVSDNLPALTAAKLDVNGGIIRFNTKGTYNFPTGFPDFAGFIMSPVDGVVIQCPATPNVAVSTIVTDNDYKVYFNAGDPHNYFIDIRANYHIGSRDDNKSLWLNGQDIYDRKPSPVNANNIIVKQVALGSGDNIIDVLPAGRSVSSLYLTPPSGGQTQMGVVPIRAGKELTAAVNNIPDNSGEIAFGFIFTEGYAVVRGYPNAGAWSLLIKYKGQPSVDKAIIPDGTLNTYAPANAMLTVRCVSPIRAQMLVNGVVVADVQVTTGVIQLAGIGATSIAAISSSNFTGWYTSDFRTAIAPRSQVLGIIGDSISDGSVHGAWPVWCAEALDASLGIRINSIENRAVSGQTLDQQIANLAAHPFVNASVVAVFIGTNDIQGGNSLAAFTASLNSLVTSIQSQGLGVVLIIPPNWYVQSDGTGLPINGAVNSQKGGDIRAAVGRVAADFGLQLLSLPSFTGPINAGYYSNSFTDPMLRDLIHPTAYGYRMYGYEIARTIASHLCPVVQLPTDWYTLTGLAAGVTGNVQYRYTSDGVEFRGSMNIASPSSTLTVATLPEGIRPSSTINRLLWATNDLIRLEVAPAGTVKFASNPSSTIVSFDGLSYA